MRQMSELPTEEHLPFLHQMLMSWGCRHFEGYHYDFDCENYGLFFCSPDRRAHQSSGRGDILGRACSGSIP